jgi:competence protein ComEC
MPKLFLLIFFLASVLFFRFVTFYQSQPTYKSGDDVSLTTILHEEPDFSNKGQNFSIKTPLNQIIFITTKATPRLHYGEEVQVSGTLQERKLPKGGTLLALSYPKLVVKGESQNPVTQAALVVRKHNKELFEKTLPPTSASLLSGIIFGAKEHFSQDFKQSLSATGVLHVIAASGMNVSFIAAALLSVFGMFMKRQTALLAGCLGIVFYVFLVGFEPSIIRAAIMGLLTFGAGMLGRQNWALFALCLAGYMMLLFQPSFLFDVGFQLSFMATLGILMLDKPLGELLKLKKLGKWGGIALENVTTTTAAQISTLPILLGVFGSVGILSLLVNALVLWVVPIVMTLGSLAVLVGFVFQPVAQLLLFLCLPFLLFFEIIVSFFGSFGWNFSIEDWPWSFSIGYYLLIGAIVIFGRLRNSPITQSLK